MDLWAHRAANYSRNTALLWVQVGSLQVWTEGGVARRNGQALLGACSPLGFLLPTLSTRQGKPGSPAQDIFGGVTTLPRPSNAKALVGSLVRGNVATTSAGAPLVDTDGGWGRCPVLPEAFLSGHWTWEIWSRPHSASSWVKVRPREPLKLRCGDAPGEPTGQCYKLKTPPTLRQQVAPMGKVARGRLPGSPSKCVLGGAQGPGGLKTGRSLNSHPYQGTPQQEAGQKWGEASSWHRSYRFKGERR